jgi:sporulation protein YlmC with PRC-barrel domain
MAISLKQLKNRWVASLSEGKLIGTVQSIYLDPEGHKLMGIQVKANRPVPGFTQNWIGIEDIRKIGVDLIYISDERVLQDLVPMTRNLDDFMGMPITSKDGRTLGTIVDVDISNKTGEVARLHLGNEQMIQVNLSEIIMGQDMILVQADAQITKVPARPGRHELIYTNLREDIKKQTTQVVQRGEDLVKQTSKALRRILEGQEADLSRKKKKVIKEISKVRKTVKKVLEKSVGTMKKKKTVKKAVKKVVKKSSKKMVRKVTPKSKTAAKGK